MCNVIDVDFFNNTKGFLKPLIFSQTDTFSSLKLGILDNGSGMYIKFFKNNRFGK